MMQFSKHGWLLISAVALAAVAAFGSVGCEPGHAGEDDTSSEREEEEGSSSEYLESKGESCSRDPDCSGYLRCISSTCTVPPAVTGEQDPQTPVVHFHSGAQTEAFASFNVELATNPDQRRRGLMYRPEMRPEWGMLFVYPDEQVRSFWMKNTFIPLDMVFLDRAGRVVHVVHRAEPETRTGRSSERPARFVLELNAGTAADRGIEPGATMTVENIPAEYAPAQ